MGMALYIKVTVANVENFDWLWLI